MDKLTLFSQLMMSIAEHLDRPSEAFTSSRRTPAVEALGIKVDSSLSLAKVRGGGGPFWGRLEYNPSTPNIFRNFLEKELIAQVIDR